MFFPSSCHNWNQVCHCQSHFLQCAFSTRMICLIFWIPSLIFGGFNSIDYHPFQYPNFISLSICSRFFQLNEAKLNKNSNSLNPMLHFSICCLSNIFMAVLTHPKLLSFISLLLSISNLRPMVSHFHHSPETVRRIRVITDIYTEKSNGHFSVFTCGMLGSIWPSWWLSPLQTLISPYVRFLVFWFTSLTSPFSSLLLDPSTPPIP